MCVNLQFTSAGRSLAAAQSPGTASSCFPVLLNRSARVQIASIQQHAPFSKSRHRSKVPTANPLSHPAWPGGRARMMHGDPRLASHASHQPTPTHPWVASMAQTTNRHAARHSVCFVMWRPQGGDVRGGWRRQSHWSRMRQNTLPCPARVNHLYPLQLLAFYLSFTYPWKWMHNELARCPSPCPASPLPSQIGGPRAASRAAGIGPPFRAKPSHYHACSSGYHQGISFYVPWIWMASSALMRVHLVWWVALGTSWATDARDSQSALPCLCHLRLFHAFACFTLGYGLHVGVDSERTHAISHPPLHPRSSQSRVLMISTLRLSPLRVNSIFW